MKGPPHQPRILACAAAFSILGLVMAGCGGGGGAGLDDISIPDPTGTGLGGISGTGGGTGTLTGTVRDAGTGALLGGILISSGSLSTLSDVGTGAYTLRGVPSGSLIVTASGTDQTTSTEYSPRSSLVLLSEGETRTLDFGLLPTSATGGGGTGGTSRSDLMLEFFTATNRNDEGDTEGDDPITELNPRIPAKRPESVDENLNASEICPDEFREFPSDRPFPYVRARLVIRNGIGVILGSPDDPDASRRPGITIQFTEMDGGRLFDDSIGAFVDQGFFDLRIETSIALLGTVHLIPINLNPTLIYCQFLSRQQKVRPVQAKITFQGKDVRGNKITIVGFLLVSPIVTVTNEEFSGQ